MAPKKRHIEIIGVPVDLGAGRRGVDMGPSAIRIADLEPRLARIRDAVKGIGYTPKSAKVTARGEAREQDGQWVFRPAGLEAGIALEGSAEELRKSQGAVVIVEGAIADAGAPLVVTSIRRE